MLPAISFNGAETFDGANNMGKLPAKPLERPKAAVKMNAGSSPDIVGFFLGATQSNRSGMRRARNDDISVSCLRDHAYGTAANIFP
jgi:hypothetical protein